MNQRGFKPRFYACAQLTLYFSLILSGMRLINGDALTH